VLREHLASLNARGFWLCCTANALLIVRCHDLCHVARRRIYLCSVSTMYRYYAKTMKCASAGG